MPTDNYRIRTMTRQDVDLAVAWATAEGWNPGRRDAECFHAADPEGFLIGEVDGEPVATVSAVRYGHSFGFIGFYIVKPACRGRGYGLRIWQAAQARLAGRLAGLDGVLAQEANYRRTGFILAYQNTRHQGTGGGPAPADPDIMPAAALPWADLRAYDRPFFPDDRERFLQAWLNQPGHTALAIRRRGALAGYGVLRPCRTGHKIGPLFADDSELAERLFLALKARAPAGDAVFLDTPAANPAAAALAQRHGLTAVFATVRMYTGAPPPLPLDRIFGVTSFELG